MTIFQPIFISFSMLFPMKAYKLVRLGKDGNIYPLYVNSTTPFEVGTWMYAVPGPMNERGKVKSKLGPLAYRPGFHCSDIPYVTHIGKKGASGKIEYMNPDTVWVEVEITDDIDYQAEAYNNGINPRTGRYNPRDADLDRIPVNGYYRYRTNPMMTGSWIIAHGMKINRILSDDEVARICAQYGLTPMPRWTSSNRKSLFGFLKRFKRH